MGTGGRVSGIPRESGRGRDWGCGSGTGLGLRERDGIGLGHYRLRATGNLGSITVSSWGPEYLYS